MELFELKCPYCGADLSAENDLDIFFCKYCGGKIILAGQSDEVIKAKARAAEQDKEIAFKKHKLKYDAEEKEKDFQRRLRVQKEQNEYGIKKEIAKHSGIFNLFKGLAILVLICFIIVYHDEIPNRIQDRKNEKAVSQINMLITEGSYDQAIESLDQIHDGSYDRHWDEKKHELHRKINASRFNNDGPKETTIDLSSKEIKEMGRYSLINYLEKKGFFNIQIIEKGFFIGSSIEGIDIDGQKSFERDETFSLDANVIITD